MFRNPDLSDFTMRIYTSLDEHGLNRRSLKARPKRNLAQGRMSVANDTLGKMYPDGPRPTGARGTFEMYFRMELPMFPAATLPFPSAGDVLPRCLSLRPATFGSGRRVCGWSGTQGAARCTRSALG